MSNFIDEFLDLVNPMHQPFIRYLKHISAIDEKNQKFNEELSLLHEQYKEKISLSKDSNNKDNVGEDILKKIKEKYDLSVSCSLTKIKIVSELIDMITGDHIEKLNKIIDNGKKECAESNQDSYKNMYSTHNSYYGNDFTEYQGYGSSHYNKLNKKKNKIIGSSNIEINNYDNFNSVSRPLNKQKLLLNRKKNRQNRSNKKKKLGFNNDSGDGGLNGNMHSSANEDAISINKGNININNLSPEVSGFFDDKDKKGVTCPCGEPDNDDMVGCEGGCERWFHFKCVNFFPKENTADGEQWYCKDCTEKMKKEEKSNKRKKKTK